MHTYILHRRADSQRIAGAAGDGDVVAGVVGGGDAVQSVQERREILRQASGFTCTCPRCVSEDSVEVQQVDNTAVQPSDTCNEHCVT